MSKVKLAEVLGALADGKRVRMVHKGPYWVEYELRNDVLFVRSRPNVDWVQACSLTTMNWDEHAWSIVPKEVELYTDLTLQQCEGLGNEGGRMKVKLAAALEALGQGKRVRVTTRAGDHYYIEVRDNVLFQSASGTDRTWFADFTPNMNAVTYEIVPREEVIKGLSITDLPNYPAEDGWVLTCGGRDGVYDWEVGYLGWRFRGGTDIYVKVESDMLKPGVWTARRVVG